jgi:hypothetical protein
MFILFWNSCDLTGSSHLRSWCWLVFVHYYFTLCHCKAVFLLFALNSLLTHCMHYSTSGLMHVIHSHPHSLRLNSRLYCCCLAITLLCMCNFENGWVTVWMRWFSAFLEGKRGRKWNGDSRSFKNERHALAKLHHPLPISCSVPWLYTLMYTHTYKHTHTQSEPLNIIAWNPLLFISSGNASDKICMVSGGICNVWNKLFVLLFLYSKFTY